MSRLAQAIAEWVVTHVQQQVANLQNEKHEFRAVFNGPPAEILREVFDLINKDRGIDATLPDGSAVLVPVVLQVEKHQPGEHNPIVGQSGVCDKNHFLDLRNYSDCPRFVGLVPPSYQGSKSLESTRSDFGLSAENNSRAVKVSDWCNDKFIQVLIDGALDRHTWPSGEHEDARALVENAIRAADQIDSRDRRGAWLVLSRLWSISDASIPFGTSVCLACGYPSTNEGTISSEEQIRVLRELSSRLEDESFRPAIERIKLRAEDDDERSALDAVLAHLQLKCQVPTALGRATPYFYGPFIGDSISPSPDWWALLTVERWLWLLGEERKRKEAIVIECENSILSQARGIVPVVTKGTKLRIIMPENAPPGIQVLISRDVAGTANHKEWSISVNGISEIEDELLPAHKAPARYSAEVLNAPDEGIKKGVIRVASLDTWEPGVVVCSRTASKGTLPKAARTSRDKVAYDCSLTMNGQGRHYLDIYVAPGVEIIGHAQGSDDGGLPDSTKEVAVALVSESQYGFEVEATSECFYQFEISRNAKEGEEIENKILRVYMSAEEVAPEECGSEFERLVSLNRQRGAGRATTDVYVDRHLRSSDLQTWMLDESIVARSFYPSVLAKDYAHEWHMRTWSSESDTIISRGRFLNDPRPSFEEMRPPEAFLQHRSEIANRIRGEEGDGLVESAKLGEWLATDAGFGEIVEGYVRAYLEWLDASPECAAWCDISIVTGFESDGAMLVQSPDAVLVSPLHPVRLAWHCLAQRALFLAQRRHPCPAASILDPDSVPDTLILPLRTASGGLKWQPFISVECSSDYWSILWNGARLDKLSRLASAPPFDAEFGITVGGVSSGFSVSQVHRALDDISGMLAAKPVLNVLVSSAAGQNNACNEGLISWCRKKFTSEDDDGPALASVGARLVQILDDRDRSVRPVDAEISNLAEDTSNAVRWFAGAGGGITPDLGIIAQLETSNAECAEVRLESPVSVGALIRYRVRQQLKAGAGAFLSETRMGMARPPSGDGLADRTMDAIVRLENLSVTRYGYVFAPSVSAIEAVLAKAEYAAVSSAAVDPACFLGGWLKSTYLWDYDLPAYSSRAGDSNGYYLLSRLKELDLETLQMVLGRLPDGKAISESMLKELILEVARRGIPTVRGLSGGDSGASGDLGLFVAARLLQDEFRIGQNGSSLFPVWTEKDGITQIVLVIPVDPFKGYLEDLGRTFKETSNQRPDLIVAGIYVSASQVQCRLTPVEVKYRGPRDVMSVAHCQDALQQAKSLSTLLGVLNTRSDEAEMVMWKLAFQHLLNSLLGFGFRVYSQQTLVANQATKWSELHKRVAGSILSDEIELEVDVSGRLIVIDGSIQGGQRDADGDEFSETIVLTQKDASEIVRGLGEPVYKVIKNRVGDWNLLPLLTTQGLQLALPEHPSHSAPTPEATIFAPEAKSSGGEVLPPLPAAAAKVTQQSEVARGIDGLVTTAIGALKEDLNNVPRDVNRVGLNLAVGISIDGFMDEARFLNLSDTNLNQLNIGVVGDLGTGKTQLIKSLIYQISRGAAQNDGVSPRILIFDYKRDYSEESFVKAVGARVVKPQLLPINIFDISGAVNSLTPWLDRLKFFSDVLDKIFPGIGPVQRTLLKKAVRRAYDQCETEQRQPNIYDVHRHYEDILGNKGADSISGIIGDLVDMKMFTPEPTSVTSFDQFLNGVVVISLDELGQDDRTKNMLVAIMLNLFYEHMLRIPKRPFVGPEGKSLRIVDSFLLVDEADNIMRYEFDVLRKILLQGREFGVGVLLASQYLRHFKAGGTDYRDPLLSWFIHKVPNVTPQELSALGLTSDVVPLAARVKSLALHECLFKTFNVHGEIVRGTPFYTMVGEQP